MQPEQIKNAINQVMPYGKYAGRRLFHLPEPYLVWFHKQGFPASTLGQQLALMYEIKLNGLESVVAPLLDEE
ncbi:DUF3820 family protein [Salinimonas sediminis]|uniref:DUF3820 family protein n=1 Tax=Salinimonas sediminis TaxID=2303538 RepID=A0A346NKE1_9ALTE|nr:DUF3820 family protein [Salinimonas sediminis]AXR05998.1 hypothetical protein D0Y50_06145 [Salinimonas sediminis]